MSNKESEPDMKLFWGCFIALITTAFAFITRAFLVNAEPFWPSTFGLDQVQGQELFGAGIWPFAISIIVFSLIIDNIGQAPTKLSSTTQDSRTLIGSFFGCCRATRFRTSTTLWYDSNYT